VAKKTSRKPSVYLTDRALRDTKGIEVHSLERLGKRVATQYLGKLEAGISRISGNLNLLRQEAPFHASLEFYRVEQHLLVCETAMEGEIIILTVLHASMDIPSRLGELEPILRLEAEMLLKQLTRSAKR